MQILAPKQWEKNEHIPIKLSRCGIMYTFDFYLEWFMHFLMCKPFSLITCAALYQWFHLDSV